jgi:hypothetical protein
MSNDKFPMPWDHTIAVRPQTEAKNGEQRPTGGLEAYCTCEEYAEGYPNGTDVVHIMEQAMHHSNRHPLRPISMVQLGAEEDKGDVLLVMGVPSTGTEEMEVVHMTIAVPSKVFNDGRIMMDFIGPIGSKFHFAAEAQRRQERTVGGGFRILGSVSPEQLEGMPGMEGIAEFLRAHKERYHGGGDDDDQEG